MQFILILIASILSALIFDVLAIVRKVNDVARLSKQSLEVMKSPDMDDDTQQKILLTISGKVFISSLKLTGWILVIILPFLAIHITEILTVGTSSFAASLSSLPGIGLSLLGFLCYFGGKKLYARFRL
jgi:hypothetical protein